MHWRKALRWVSTLLILAGIIYFVASWTLDYSDPIPVTEQALAMIVVGFVLRFVKPSE